MVVKNAAGAKQAAEKGRIPEQRSPQDIPQGLKPVHFIGFIGTTKVVQSYDILYRLSHDILYTFDSFTDEVNLGVVLSFQGGCGGWPGGLWKYLSNGCGL